MKFLDKIEALEARAEALTSQLDAVQRAKEELSNLLGDAARQLAELQRAIADAPKPFQIEIKQNGQDFTVSEKDGLILLAALIRALEGEEVTARLHSGQTPKLKLTDIEQIAALILVEAAK